MSRSSTCTRKAIPPTRRSGSGALPRRAPAGRSSSRTASTHTRPLVPAWCRSMTPGSPSRGPSSFHRRRSLRARPPSGTESRCSAIGSQARCFTLAAPWNCASTGVSSVRWNATTPPLRSSSARAACSARAICSTALPHTCPARCASTRTASRYCFTLRRDPAA